MTAATEFPIIPCWKAYKRLLILGTYPNGQHGCNNPNSHSPRHIRQEEQKQRILMKVGYIVHRYELQKKTKENTFTWDIALQEMRDSIEEWDPRVKRRIHNYLHLSQCAYLHAFETVLRAVIDGKEGNKNNNYAIGGDPWPAKTNLINIKVRVWVLRPADYPVPAPQGLPIESYHPVRLARGRPIPLFVAVDFTVPGKFTMHNFLKTWNQQQEAELAANPEFISGYYSNPLAWRPNHPNPDFPHPTRPCDRVPADLQTVPHCNITNPTEFYHWVRMVRLQTGETPNIRVVCHDHTHVPGTLIYNADTALNPLRQHPKYESWVKRTCMLLPQPQVANPMDAISWVTKRLPGRGARYPHPHHQRLVDMGLRDEVTHFVREQRRCNQAEDTPCTMSDYEPTTDGIADHPRFEAEDIIDFD